VVRYTTLSTECSLSSVRICSILWYATYKYRKCFYFAWLTNNVIFTALHGMQTRYSDENSVCPSVRLSVTRVNCDKTVERSVQIYIPYERTFSLDFWEEEWLVGATPSTWNFGSTDPRWSEIADFQPIFARSASAVTPSKKVQLMLIGSPLRAFLWA